MKAIIDATKCQVCKKCLVAKECPSKRFSGLATMNPQWWICGSATVAEYAQQCVPGKLSK